MSRETYFRAWDMDAKSFVEEPILVDNFGQVYVVCEESSDKRGTCLITHKPNAILEFDTGLKDKNGKEILTGDIIEASIDGVWAAGNAVCFGKKKWKLEVIYNDIRFMDVFRVIGSRNAPDRIYYLFDKELSELEVIGNIHENPELLKEEG